VAIEKGYVADEDPVRGRGCPVELDGGALRAPTTALRHFRAEEVDISVSSRTANVGAA
jgi:hypothetical protein